jgi:hypothetical protein
VVERAGKSWVCYQKQQMTEKIIIFQKIKEYDAYISVYNLAKIFFLPWLNKITMWWSALCMRYSDTLPPLETGKRKTTYCFKNLITIPTKQDANISRYITPIIFIDSLTPVTF